MKAVAARTKNTYVMSNNHNLGKATVNALELTSILKGKPVAAPATLIQTYPELKRFTTENG